MDCKRGATGMALLAFLAAAVASGDVHVVNTATSISFRPDHRQGVLAIDIGHGVNRIDLEDPAFPGVVVFGKRPDTAYRTVRIDGREIALPAPVEARVTVPLIGKFAALEAGVRGAPDPLPRVRLPDWPAVRDAELPDAPRTENAADLRRLVRAAASPATIYLRTPIANQTAHPDDPSRKSVYVAASHPLFNQADGKAESILHYLIEIPIDPAWTTSPGDIQVTADAATIRAHIPGQQVATSNGMQRITGNGPGGLTQAVQSVVVGDDGNLYFSRSYRGPIRFNVKTARYEVAPVDLWTWYSDHLTADDSNIRRAHPDAKPRPDPDTLLYTLDNRLYVLFGRYLRREPARDKDLLACAVISAPLAHWDDRDTFERHIRIIAEGHPTAPHHLFDHIAEPEDHRRKIRLLSGVGRHLLLHSNSFNRLWWIHLDQPGGSTTRIVPVEVETGGQRVEQFHEYAMLHLDSHGHVIGAEIRVRFAGSDGWTPMWIDANTGKLGAAIPATATKKHNTGNDFGLRHHLDYTRNLTCGESQWDKSAFARELAMAHFEPGHVTVYWDADDAIRAAVREADATLPAKMHNFSSGPGFMIAIIPGNTRRVIGVSDYPAYYLSYFDIPRTGDVTRRAIRCESAYTPVGLGPYTHAWRGRQLWLAGYTGVVQFTSEDKFTGDAPIRAIKHAHDLRDIAGDDSARAGPFKWFTSLRFGLDGKTFTTGYDMIARGGTPYSVGLRWRDGGERPAWHALSQLARTLTARNLATRYRISPNGNRAIDIISFAQPNEAMATAITPEKPPEPSASRLLFYEDRGQTVVDRFSLAVADEESRSLNPESITISSNGLYALLVTGDGLLATLALDSLQFIDALRLPGNVAGSSYRPTLMRTPGDGGVLVVERRRPSRFTLVHVAVADNGSIALRPLINLIPDTDDLFDGAAALLGREDGRTDLLIGPPFTGDATLTVVPDMLR